MCRSTKTRLIASIFLIFSIQSSFAEIKLPAIVNSNMVLQRNTTIEIWGWANANEKITIKTSWLKKTETVKADSEGNWSLQLKTTNSKNQQSISLSSKTSTILLDNILFGEVWLCSGQSNMYQPLQGYPGQPTFNSLQAITNSKNSQLRLFTVSKNASKIPLKNLEKFESWQEASPKTVASFSAVAYFFGQQLQQTLDVPVGLIHSSFGGSRVEAWLSKKALSKYQKVDLSKVNITKNPNGKPTVLFNAMIHPLVKYKIRGVLWYQGESNRAEPEKYKQLFPEMVNNWRSLFKIGDFPFYYVQIAPFDYSSKNSKARKLNSAFLRESQLQCVDVIPNSGMAVTLDLGRENYIHPPQKKEVADRLLYLALHNTYGIKNNHFLTPKYDSYEIKENSIEISFKNIGLGLYAKEELFGFEIAGSDGIFYKANAKISGGRKRNTVTVKSSKVDKPVAVRYAWKNWTQASLFGTNLLPVSSFRTDLWKN